MFPLCHWVVEESILLWEGITGGAWMYSLILGEAGMLKEEEAFPSLI